MRALFIIDMQNSVFYTPRHNQESVINKINKLSSLMRSTGDLVIYIQQNGTREDELFEGTEGWQIIGDLDVDDSDIKLTKTACDSFFKTYLEGILRENNVEEVVITGAVTEFCVDTTLRSCLSKEFNVTMISDAHTTGNREHLSAELIIKHHNWTWENLIIPNVNLRVVTADGFTR